MSPTSRVHTAGSVDGGNFHFRGMFKKPNPESNPPDTSKPIYTDLNHAETSLANQAKLGKPYFTL